MMAEYEVPICELLHIFRTFATNRPDSEATKGVIEINKIDHPDMR
jgi:hypothetical protein